MVVAWATLRAYWGYGVRDMGLYIDPLTDTSRFLTAAAGRFPILLLGQWSPIPSGVAIMLRPPVSTALWWFAVVFLGVLLLAMSPLLRRDQRARFWAMGMVLAAIPVSATLPSDRLLTFVGIGAAGLLAQFWEFVFAAGRRADEPALECPGEGGGVVPRGRSRGHRPARPSRAGRQPRWGRHGSKSVSTSPRPLGSSLEDRTVVIVNAPSPVNRKLPHPPPGAGWTVRTPAHAGPGAGDPLRDHPSPRRADARHPTPRAAISRWFLDQVFRSERRRFAPASR